MISTGKYRNSHEQFNLILEIIYVSCLNCLEILILNYGFLIRIAD